MGTSWLPRNLWFAAGLVSKGSASSTTLDPGWGTFVLSLLLGAFCGLMVGLILSHVIQFVTYLRGRQTSGYGWTIVSMAVGAAVFAWWTLSAGGDAEAPDPQGGEKAPP